MMSLAVGYYQEGHLLGFYPIFRIEGAADHLDPEDWIPGPTLSKWRSSRGSDLQGFAKRFRKALSKTPQHHGSPPCLNFGSSKALLQWRGGIGTDVVPRDILSSATLTNALHEGIPGQARARRPPPPQSFVQFFGSRVPPTTSIQRIGFRRPVEAECRGSA